MSKTENVRSVMRGVLGVMCAGILTGRAAAQNIFTADDSISAAAVLTDYVRVCAKSRPLWPERSCGRLVIVDPRSRTTFLSHKPTSTGFAPYRNVFAGRWPDTMSVANTSVKWEGHNWAVVRWPLPLDPAARMSLLMHESFHSIQKSIGISDVDALSPHLDEALGRVWMRLEVAALAHALAASDIEARRHAKNAAFIRRKRYALYPGADSLERALEMAEGIAEYTGWRSADDALALGPLMVIDKMRSTMTEPSFVRSFAYATGPALGYLLDRFDANWRTRLIVSRNPGALLRAAVGANGVMPTDSALIVIAEPYGYRRILREETNRATARAATLAAMNARFVDGPVIEIPDVVDRSYDPLSLVPLGAHGTVYPRSASFSGAWGRVTIDSIGVLLLPDLKTLRLERPASTTGARIEGRGWLLTLKEGWSIVDGTRAGDLRVVQRP